MAAPPRGLGEDGQEAGLDEVVTGDDGDGHEDSLQDGGHGAAPGSGI